MRKILIILTILCISAGFLSLMVLLRLLMWLIIAAISISAVVILAVAGSFTIIGLFRRKKC